VARVETPNTALAWATDDGILVLTIVIHVALLGLCWWMIHMIRKSPHPNLHDPPGTRKIVGKR
jgi:hypothetical protein